MKPHLTHIPASGSYPGMSTLTLGPRTFKAVGVHSEEAMVEAVAIYFPGLVDEAVRNS